MNGNLLASVWLTAFVSCVPSLAIAAPPYQLSWVRTGEASNCPDASRVSADVARRLGRWPFATGGARAAASIEALVSRENELWRASIEMRDAAGTSIGSRSVASKAAGCGSLAAAAALAIALMIEPELITRAPESEGAPPPPPPPPREAPRNQGQVASARDLSARGGGRAQALPRGSLAGGGAMATGILPSTGFGVAARGELEIWPHVVAAFGAYFLLAQDVKRSDALAHFSASLGAVGPCYRLRIGRQISVASCAALLVGALHISVDNPAPVKPGDRLWLGASTGFRIALDLGGARLEASADAVAHFSRRDYLLDRNAAGAASLFREPGVGGLGALTLGANL